MEALPAKKTTKIIVANNISKSFVKKKFDFANGIRPIKETKEAVKEISLEINSGEFVGFLGSNGAGKTTFLKILSGVIHPSSGEAKVMGFVPWEKKYQYLRQISLVMGQKNQLWWDLPAMDSFNLLREIYEIPKDKFKKNLDRMVDVLDMKNIVNHRLRNMSLGERMKCELTACFLHDPKVIFLDEPTIGLDVVSAKSIRDFLKLINREKGSTIILTSHYMADIEALCDRIIIIDKGSKIFDGQLSNLLKEHNLEKTIKIIFSTMQDRKKFASLNCSKESQDGFGIVKVTNEQISEVVEQVYKLFPASNISIADTEIEEVISQIFTDQKNQSI